MTGRDYPDEPVGPFPAPPRTFEDREGREVQLRGYERGADVPDELVAMYETFDPADRAQGIPPSGDSEIRDWLAELFETGYNVAAWHDGAVAGHATLVPAGDDEESTPHELAIFVLQTYQQAGIGKQLLRTLLGFGAAHGVDRVWLTVEQWNRPAIGLYEDVGFETISARSFEREMSVRVQTDSTG